MIASPLRRSFLAVLPIRVAGAPILRQKTRRVKVIDASLQRLIDDMIDTMRAAPGVGLAPPQVGSPLRIAVIGLPEQEVIVLVNPEIVRRSGERLVEEGWLSVPGYVAEVNRSPSVAVKRPDRQGAKREGGLESSRRPLAPAKGAAARVLPPEVVAYKVEWRYSNRCVFTS